MEIRNNLSEQVDNGEKWIGISRGSGVTKDDLVHACVKVPGVREFFEKVLTRQPPKADDRFHHDFRARLRELEAEISRESRQAEQQQQQQQGSETAAASLRNPSGITARAFAEGTLHDHASARQLRGPAVLRRSATQRHFGVSQRKLTQYKQTARHALARPTIRTSASLHELKLPPL